MTHRYKIQWLWLGIVLLSLHAFIASWLYWEHGHVDAAERERLQGQARVIDDNLGRQLEGVRNALGGILDDLEHWDPRRIGRQLGVHRLGELTNAMPGARTLLILDSQGIALAANREPLIGMDFSKRPYFTVPQERPDRTTSYISPPFKNVSGVYSIHLTRAIVTPNGNFAGIVTANLDPDYFNVVLRSVLYAPDMSVSVAHGDGVAFLYESPNDRAAGIDRAKPGTFFTRHLESGKTSTSMTGISYAMGEERLMAMRTISPAALNMDKPLIVAVGRDLSAVFADWRKEGYFLGAFAGVMSLFCILGLFFYQRRQIAQAHLNAGFEAERRRAEQELREREYRYRTAVETSADGFWVIEAATGRILEVNDRYVHRSGYAREELLSLSIFDIDAMKTREQIKTFLSENRSQSPVIFESLHRAKDGHVWPVEVSTVHIPTDGGLRFSFLRDITERRRAAESAERERIRLQTILKTASDGIHVLDSDGVLVEANDAFLKMVGYDDSLIGKPWITDWDTPGSGNEIKARNADLIVRRGRAVFETRHRCRDGSVIDVEVSACGIEIDGKGYLYASSRDITERKRLEAMHLQAQKLESLGTLAGGIAHDFNNILAAIRGNADLAAEDMGPGHAAAESIEEIKKASSRAHELVRRIMAFGRPKDARAKVVDLSTVVDEVLKLLRPTIPAGVALSRDFAADTLPVLADSAQIHEVIVNLTTNAIHAIGARGGSIEYRIEPVPMGETLARRTAGLKPGQYARLIVSDDGCGMDAATMERIFDAFYTTKPLGEGTGLGLSMVHGVMKGLGGAVTVESSLGKGSRFALYFPAADEQPGNEEQSAPASGLLSTGQRVLYVDDEEALVSLAKRVISRLGHAVTAFTDPREAMAAFRVQPQAFDVVVTDLAMPQMSGFELAREVLALRSEMPVLMTTGNIQIQDVQLAREMGIREVLLKPVGTEELGRVLDQLPRIGQSDTKPFA